MANDFVTFKQFESEVYNSVGNIAIGDTNAANSKPDVKLQKRKNLPQIANFESFMKDIYTNNITMFNDKVQTNTLKPTQNEFNNDKVQKMVAAKSYNTKSIIVSKDNYIVDGHHRWKAADEDKQPINIIRLDKEYSDIIEFLEDKDYIENKAIHENKGTNK